MDNTRHMYKKIINKVFNIPKNYKIPNQIKKETKDIIQELYGEIVNSKNNIKFYPTVAIKGLGEIIRAVNYRNIPIEIRQDMEHSNYVHEIYNIVLNSGRVLNLYFFFEKKENHDSFISE